MPDSRWQPGKISAGAAAVHAATSRGNGKTLYRDMKNYYDRSVNACEGNAVASAHFKKHMVQICNEVENMTMKKQAMPSDDPGSAPVMVMVGRGATGQGAAKQGHRKVMTGNSSTK